MYSATVKEKHCVANKIDDNEKKENRTQWTAQVEKMDNKTTDYRPCGRRNVVRPERRCSEQE